MKRNQRPPVLQVVAESVYQLPAIVCGLKHTKSHAGNGVTFSIFTGRAGGLFSDSDPPQKKAMAPTFMGSPASRRADRFFRKFLYWGSKHVL